MLDVLHTRSIPPASFDPAQRAPRLEDERIISLFEELPSASAFVRRVAQALEEAGHASHTIECYRAALAGFLRWNGALPHQTTRRDVERYVRFLVEGGASALQIGQALAALRLAFDRFSGMRLAADLRPPRPPRFLPMPLSPFEVVRLLRAAPSLREKLLLGLMYATGSRLSEISKIRWRDLDVAGRTSRIWQDRRHRDRALRLPVSFGPLIERLATSARGSERVFASPPGEHGSFAEACGAFLRAASIAGIQRPFNPITLRRSLSMHLVSNQGDLRFVDAVLGRRPLVQTTLYVPTNRLAQRATALPIGSIATRMQVSKTEGGRVAKALADVEISGLECALSISNIVVRRARGDWLLVHVPPIEDWRESRIGFDTHRSAAVADAPFFRWLESTVAQHFLTLDLDVRA